MKTNSFLRSRVSEIIASTCAFLLLIVAIALAFSGLIYLSGFDLLTVYKSLFEGSFGSAGTFAQTLIRMGPLLFVSLGLIIAFRCGLWNIGAEGQIFLGALGATLVGVYVDLPAVFHIFFCMIVSFLFGGLWAGAAGYLKTRFSANEVITTLLSNFIAIWITYYFLQFHLKPSYAFNPVSKSVLPSAELPIILKGTLLHAGIPMALCLTVIVWLLINFTYLGYTINVVGINTRAAEYGGIKVNQTILVSMFLSGGLAGLAGMGEVLGVHHLLIRGVSPNYGFIAIAIVLISRMSPFGAVIVSLFFGAVLAGGRHLQATVGVPTPLVDVLVGLFIVFMLLQPLLEKYLSLLIMPYEVTEASA